MQIVFIGYRFSFSCQDKRLHNILTLIFCRSDTELLLEDDREMALGAEATLVSNFGNGVFPDSYRLNKTIKTYRQLQAFGVGIQPGASVYGCEGYFMWKSRSLTSALMTSRPRSAWNSVTRVFAIRISCVGAMLRRLWVIRARMCLPSLVIKCSGTGIMISMASKTRTAFSPFLSRNWNLIQI